MAGKEFVCTSRLSCAHFKKNGNGSEKCVFQHKHPKAREEYVGICLVHKEKEGKTYAIVLRYT